MTIKNDEKQLAIKLRKCGFSYNEILKEVSVAKSTLSLWLRDIGMARQQQQKLTQKRLAAAKRGGAVKKLQRIKKESFIKMNAAKDIISITDYNLLLIGATLYWAEGSKQKDHSPSVGVIFSNSDLLMLKVFLLFLDRICNIDKNRIFFELFIHENADYKLAQKWWSEKLNTDLFRIDKVYFKKNPPRKASRKNIENNYHGQLRVRVASSTDLNRKIRGWIEGIISKTFDKK